MVDPVPLYLSPERLEQLQRLTDAIRLRAALYPPPKPPKPRRRSRRYPVGRPNPPQAVPPASTPPGLSAGLPAHVRSGGREQCASIRVSGASRTRASRPRRIAH